MTVHDHPRRPLATGVEVDEILVPLDGSPLAERAVPVARWIAERLGAEVRDIHVADDDRPADAIAAAIGYGDQILGCMATHGRDRGTGLIGSVAHAVVGQLQSPIVLVGPHAARTPPANGPVAVMVSGDVEDRDLADVGKAWAIALGRPLLLLTVVEPAPEPVRPEAHHHRSHGPDDPEAYLAQLAAAVAAADVDVRTETIEDPITVRSGFSTRMQSLTPALVVVGERRDHTLRHAVLGDHCAQIVHDSPAPTVVVPIGFLG